jgi:hypothetical protein
MKCLTSGVMAVVLLFIVGMVTGLAQERVSSPASEPATLGETNQALSLEELAKLKQNPVSGLREVVLQGSGSSAGADKPNKRTERTGHISIRFSPRNNKEYSRRCGPRS